MKFTIPLPPTTNHAYATQQGRWYKVKKATDWENECGWLIRPKETFLGFVGVNMTFHLKRDRDIDNVKLILDLLQTQRVYENDKQVQWLTVKKVHDKKGTVDICVEELEV
jgi:Holliday junction resolvase RusA-like endonuclease